MKRTFTTLLIALMLSPLAVQAGKEERDFINSTVEPAIKEATAAYKQSCGCDIKFDAKLDSFKNIDEMRQIKHFAGTITQNVGGYCSDAATKKVMCQMKTLEFQKTGETSFKFSSGKGQATSDGSSYPSWDMLAKQVDK